MKVVCQNNGNAIAAMGREAQWTIRRFREALRLDNSTEATENKSDKNETITGHGLILRKKLRRMAQTPVTADRAHYNANQEYPP